MPDVIQIILPPEPGPPEQVEQVVVGPVTVVEVVEAGPRGPQGPLPTDAVTHAELNARIPVDLTVSSIPPTSPTYGELWVDLN